MEDQKKSTFEIIIDVLKKANIGISFNDSSKLKPENSEEWKPPRPAEETEREE